MSERSDHDRLRRVEVEVEALLADVREEVRSMRSTVERIRALREPQPPGELPLPRH